MWQDWAIAVIQWVFALALIPTIRDASAKPSLSSSLLTAILLTALSGIFITLELWNGALSSLAVAIAWFILTFQRWRLDRKKAAEQARFF
jgi:hypothetical protein